MGLLDTKRYEIITPDSETTLAYEEYEFLLTWYNRDGAQVQWLFCDWETRDAADLTAINIEDEERIESLPVSEKRVIRLIADDIDRGDRELFESLLVAKVVFRVFRGDSELFEPGGYQRYAKLSGRFNWVQSKQRFQFITTIQEIEPALWR